MLATTCPRMRTAAVVAAAVMLSTPGCVRHRALRIGDLGTIVARPDEAPPGLVYSPKLSGSAGLEQLRSDPEGRQALGRAGFRAGYVAILATPDLLDYLVLSRPRQAAPHHGTLVTADALLFADDDGASEGLAFLHRDAAARLTDENVLPAQEFGEGAFALRGIDDDGRPSIVYGWSEDNACQSVWSNGPVDPADVLFIARNMHRRAEASS